MKKQTKLNWQTIVFAAVAAVVFIFAANSPTSAQTTYKVGDRAETLSAGDWVEVEIIKIGGNGDYVIRYVKSGVSGAWAQDKHLRPIKTKVQTSNQNNADNRVQNPSDGKARTATGGGEAAAQREKSIGERFGSREPRTCADTKAPAKGAITAVLALKYLNCQMESVWSNDLYLVENVKVEVGGGISYAAIIGQYSLDQIDVKYPVYPIRGSFLKYQCQDPETAYVGPPDTNCTTYNQPKATGYCYKTTFGDWRCNMADRSGTETENVRRRIAPPKP